jgi:hypothetical protein
MLVQCSLNFSEFNPVAVYLNLMVNPTTKLDIAVGQVTRKIAGPIQSFTWI